MPSWTYSGNSQLRGERLADLRACYNNHMNDKGKGKVEDCSMTIIRQFCVIVTVGILFLLSGGCAWAQSTSDPTPVPPEVMLIDKNKINLGTAAYENQDDNKEITIGDVTNRTFTSGLLPVSELGGALSSVAVPGASGSMVNGYLEMHVQWGAHYHNFLVGSTQSSNGQGALYRDAVMQGPYFEKGAGNATLACTGPSITQLYGNGGNCIVTEADGTRVSFLMGFSKMDELNHQYPLGTLQSIIKPDGETISSYTANYGARLVSSSRGVIISSDGFPPNPPTVPGTYYIVPGAYTVQYSGHVVNSSIDYCDPTSAICVGSEKAIKNVAADDISVDSNHNIQLVRQSQYVNGNLMRVFIYTNAIQAPCGSVLCIPSASASRITSPLGVGINYFVNPGTCGVRCEAWSAYKNNTTTYQFYYAVGHGNGTPPTTTTVMKPDGSTNVYTFSTNGDLTSLTDGLGRVTTYQYEYGSNWGVTLGRPYISRIYAPNSPDANHGYTQYDYTHGNLATVTVVPTDGGKNLVTQYGITLTCDTVNYKICNKPQYVIDPNGNRTDYSYDPAHGGMLTETGPADSGGVRPQKRYSYTQIYPKVLNSSGVLVNSLPLWRLTKISQCRVATAANPASCVGTADEIVTTYVYNNNNAFLTSETTAAGNGSNSQTVSYSYDYVGNIVSVSGPRTDIDDTRYTTYDSLRRKVFEIGADPDGAGALPRPITRHVYDADGNEIRTDYGVGNAKDGSDFVASHFKRMTYDTATGLLVKTEEVAS